MTSEAQHASAAELVLGYADVIDDGTRLMAGWTEWGKAAVRYATEDALAAKPNTKGRVMPPRPWHPDIMRESHFAALDAATLALWRKRRVTYDIDADLWDELADTRDDTIIPAGLMRELAHPDPFVAFPKPLVLPMENGETMHMGGFFVSGRADLDQVEMTSCSTHAARANGHLGLLIGAYVFGADGSQMLTREGTPDMIWSRITLEVGKGDVTVGQLVEGILARYSTMPNTGDTNATLPLAIRACVGVLIYLCARNAELESDPQAGKAAAVRHGEGRRKVKAPEVHRVGYRLGRALRAYKKRVAEQREEAVRTGRRMPPHVRRTHPHTFRYGKDKALSYVKVLPPIDVNMDLDDGETVTIVPVKK